MTLGYGCIQTAVCRYSICTLLDNLLMPQIRRLSMTLCYVMFTFLCTFSACYAMRSVMSQINNDDDDDGRPKCLHGPPYMRIPRDFHDAYIGTVPVRLSGCGDEVLQQLNVVARWMVDERLL